jgi:hypothetical protein
VSDESLFREVDEEVRQEQFKKLWARYGNLIVAVCFVVVAGVAGFKGWQYWQVKQSETAGEAFFAAVKLAGTGKADEAAKQFATVSHTGFGLLAKLREANVLASQNKAADAVKIYDAIAADSSADAALRELARVRAAMALADTAAPADLEARLKDFNVAGNPWRHVARETTAAALWRAKDYAGADKQVLAILGDGETPAGVQQRAKVLADLLAPLLAQK